MHGTLAPPAPKNVDAAPVLEAEGVWKVFGREGAALCTRSQPPVADEILRAGGIIALRDASFSISRGEIFVIMGLSGSGKSTLLRCLTGLYEATLGNIRLAGSDISRAGKGELRELRRHKISMVFQNFALLPHLNAIDNVAFPLRVQGVENAERRRRAADALKLVGLGELESRFPGELSGGQQQRVGIARSLVTEPEIWFLDEPFSALDPLIRREMQDEFLRLQSQLNKSIVFVTHDLEEAVRLGDRIAVMSEGRILQTGTPEELLLNPIDQYVKRFFGGIARDKIIRAGSVAEPLTPDCAMDRPVPTGATLSEVAQQVIESVAPVAVQDVSGTVIGQISRRGLAKWLS